MTFTIVAPEQFVFAHLRAGLRPGLPGGLPGRDPHPRPVQALRRGPRPRRRRHRAAARREIGAAIAAYGVEIQRVVITHVQPPRPFMASRESRQLAGVQRDEQTDRHALEERLLADREALERQRITAQRERIELEAANEDLRLQPPPGAPGGVSRRRPGGTSTTSASPSPARSPATAGRWSRSDRVATSPTPSSSGRSPTRPPSRAADRPARPGRPRRSTGTDEAREAHDGAQRHRARAPAKRHGLDPRRHVPHGFGGLLPGGAAGPHGVGRRVLDGRAPGHGRRVPARS